MLTKRTQILFDQDLWEKLVKLARKQKSSVGSIIRSAVEEKYLEEEKLTKRRTAFNAILKHRPAPVKGKIDYKALINYGRKR